MLAPSSASVESLRRIESVCNRFEQSTPEQQRSLETFLDGAEGEERAVLLAELIALDIELRRERGDPPAYRYYDRLWDSIGRPHDSDGRVMPRRDGWRAMLSPPPDAPVSIPSSERYRFVERIGRGGIGEVWRVHDTHGERTVAVKLLRHPYRRDAAAMSRFRREARLTGTLQHPGIPPVYDHGRLDDGAIYFSMRLVEGRTLANLLRDRPVADHDLSGLLKVFEQVAQTLAYVHTERVVHRDLKPPNVMVGRFGEVQVMDWGLAKRLDSADPESSNASENATDGCNESSFRPLPDADTANDDIGLTRAGDIVGTPHCMSPEQARGDLRLVDTRADVFGLGAILFEILTRRRLCEGLDTNQAVQKLAEGDLSDSLEILRGSGHDPELIRLCEHCLQPSPDDRPSDADEVATRVSGYLASVAQRLRDAEIDRSAALVRAAEERKRRRIVVQLACAVAAISTIGVAGVAWQWNRAVESSRSEAAARRLADERFLQAQRVVRDYLTEVSERDGMLARTPGTQTLRRALLEKARDYYAQFLVESSTDPSVRFETADAYARLGEIMHLLDPGGAEVFSLYGDAIKLYEELANEAHGDDAIRAAEGLADAHTAVGDAYLAGSLDAKAETAYAAATEVLADRILARDHDHDRYQLSLAKVTNNIALTRANRGRKQEAETLFLEAIALAEPLLESHGDDPESLAVIATLYSDAGVHYGFKLKDWKSSLDYGERAAKLLSRMVEIAPTIHRYENELAGSHNNIALALFQNRRHDEARESFLKAAAIRERLHRQNPDIPEYAMGLGHVYNNLATYSVKRDQARDSIEYYQKAAALKGKLFRDHPQVVKYGTDTIDLLGSIATTEPRHERVAGAFNETIRIYEQLLRERPDSRGFMFNLALFRSLVLTDAEPFASTFRENIPSTRNSAAETGALLALTDGVSHNDPELSPRYRAIRALVLLRDHQPDAALKTIDRTPPDTQDELTWLVESQIRSRLGDQQVARETLERATAKLDKQPYPAPELVILRAEAEQAMGVGDP